MRYVTATIGAIVVFFSVLVVAIVAHSFLPPSLQGDDWTFRFPPFHVRGNPLIVFGPVVGLRPQYIRFALR